MHYTYMLKCNDNTYYIGYTNDLQKRIKAHNEGKGAKYTKGRGPVELIYYEEYEDKQTAMRREWEMKRLTRKEKEWMQREWKHRAVFEMQKEQQTEHESESRGGNVK